jgi:putative tryptophan/tyrosine transport system substrate-binding protein
MRRREFISLIGSTAVAWPVVARAQQSAMPVVAFINGGSANAESGRVAAFRKGLSETGYIEDQNVRVEYHWLEGRYERVAALLTEIVGRHVAVIATPAFTSAALAAKAATATIPIVFSVGEDPVALGLVVSLAHPGGNATGINIFAFEIYTKRLALMHELLPKATRFAVLINPANVVSAREVTSKALKDAARTLGLCFEHGLYCIGCCWMLMALLFIGGVMNVLWIALLSVLVFAEKVTPVGRWIARMAGVGFVAAGLWMLVAPSQ